MMNQKKLLYVTGKEVGGGGHGGVVLWKHTFFLQFAVKFTG